MHITHKILSIRMSVWQETSDFYIFYKQRNVELKQ